MKRFLAIILAVLCTLTFVSCQKLSVRDIDKKVTIKAERIFQNEDVEINVEKLEFGDSEVVVTVKFKSFSDTDLEILCGASGYSVNSVNGYMIPDGYLNFDLESKETTTKRIDFSYSELLSLGVTTIADFEIGFAIKGGEKGTVYTGPLSVKTSAYKSYDYKNNTYQKYMENGAFEKALDCKVKYFSTDCVYNKNQISVESIAVLSSKENIVLCIEVKNASTKEMVVKALNLEVNGTLISKYLDVKMVNAGKKDIISISFKEAFYDYDGDWGRVKEIDKISFDFGAANTSWEIDDIAKQINVSVKNIKMPNTIMKK